MVDFNIASMLNPQPQTQGAVSPDRAKALQAQQMAQILLSSGAKTNNPLVAALTGFLGTQAASDAASQMGAVQQQEFETEEARKARQEMRLDKQLQLTEQGQAFQQKMAEKQFSLQSANLALEREKFNAQQMRDAANSLVTKIADPKTGVDLLFQGIKPLNEGLEKGYQWGVDKSGNRVAVPIPTAPSEKAAQVANLTLETVNRLLENKSGVRANYGAIDKYLPSVRSDAMNAETDINQLRSLLTVENLKLMSGVLTDRDMQILTNITAGGLADTATEKGALNALRSIKATLEGKKADFQKSVPQGFVLEGFE